MARSESVAKRKASGGGQISASFTKDELALLAQARERGGYKTNKATLLAGLQAIRHGAPEPTPEAALRVFERMVRGKAR